MIEEKVIKRLTLEKTDQGIFVTYGIGHLNNGERFRVPDCKKLLENIAELLGITHDYIVVIRKKQLKP
jgi:uncharacterized protein (DUF488 family)